MTADRIAFVSARVASAQRRGWLWVDEPHQLVGWCTELLDELRKWRPIQTELPTEARSR